MYQCKYTRFRVRREIRRMAKQLMQEKRIGENTIFMVMLNGGVWFSSRLFDALGDIVNEVYYIKGHSYRGKHRGEFTWEILPEVDLRGKDVVVIDDICDSGETLRIAYEQFHEQAKSICAVTLIKRVPCPLKLEMPVYTCIEDGTKDFFVGCGLDDNGRGRLIRKICIC